MASLARRGGLLTGTVVLVVGIGCALVPLVATAWFSLRGEQGRLSLDAYAEILREPAFRASMTFSVQLAILTIALTVTLVTVTAYGVHITFPRLRPAVEFVSLLPIVVPPIVLVVGLLRGFGWAPAWFYGSSAILVVGYTVLAMPFAYRIIDARLRGLNIRTLAEAARSLGADWGTIMFRVVLPNLRSSIFSVAFMTFAIVMGEFTMALIMQFNTYAVYLSYVWESRATGAAALSVVSFAITWVGMLVIVLVGKRFVRGTVQIGGNR